ncbi:hypothetical protein Noda2021_03840 [Candidatus Dependentiae bacterium Noda2021]|nr:hypothetical protein Noda2021_03840 [Candidatus Dependentiae bacterium Noda2021]
MFRTYIIIAILAQSFAAFAMQQPSVVCNKPTLLLNLQDAQKQLKKTKTTINHFANPTTLERARNQLAPVLAYFSNKTIHNWFGNHYYAAPLFQKRLLCEVLYECVDTLDMAIKMVKSSALIERETKHAQVVSMIQDFFDLFKNITTTIMPANAIQYHVDWSQRRYLEQVEYFLKKKQRTIITDYELKKSSGFSVQAAIMGSVTAFERHFPDTLEDLFMLIHQNSLTVIAAIFNSLLGTQPLDAIVPLPSLAKELIAKLQSPQFAPLAFKMGLNHDLAPQRLGVRNTPTTTEILFNMPLRNHSSTMQVIVNKATQECYFAVQFVGQARGRWQQAQLCAAFSPYLSGLEHKERIVCDRQAGIVSIVWNIKNSANIQSIEDYITILALLSYERDLKWRHLEQLNTQKVTIKSAIEAVKNEYGDHSILHLLQPSSRFF